MSATRQQDYMVVDRPDLTVLDTRSMPWEPFEGFDKPGVVRKVLSRFEDGPWTGEPQTFIFYMPPGFTLANLPYRHYHATVEEMSYTLAGELPHWEYESAEQQHGTYVVRRPAQAMQRLGGSIHGLEPGPQTITGYMSLMVRSGTGNWIPDANFDEETHHVDYEPGWQPAPKLEERVAKPGKGLIIDWSDLKIYDTRLMDWEQLGGQFKGGYRKVIARDDAGPKYMMLFFPPGFTIGKSAYRFYRKSVHELSYILWGDFPSIEYESRDQTEGTVSWRRQGYFAHRRPGSIHGLEPGTTTPTGFCMLYWRLGAPPTAAETLDADAIEVPFV